MPVVFSIKQDSIYDDIPGQRYHFPRTYLKCVQAAVGDLVLYYEPGRVGLGDGNRTGRKSYVALATLDRVESDPCGGDENYAFVRDYTEFSEPVAFRFENQTLERGLQKSDGSTNKGLFGRAVRTTRPEDAAMILRLGLSIERPDMVADLAFDRTRQWVSRAERDRAFRDIILKAYDKRCAITGLRLVNGGGAAEVQAAHLQAVSANGPDSVRNGLALTQTIHWLFDRFSFTIDDDHRLVLPTKSPIELPMGILRQGQPLAQPAAPAQRPHPRFLRWHREQFEKKWSMAK